MPRKTVAVVHHPRSYFALDLQCRVRDEIDLIWVLPDIDNPTFPRRLPARLGPVVDIAGLDLDTAAARIAAHQPDGIVTFVDDTLVLTAELAHRLGLPSHDPGDAHGFVDKRLQRQLLDAAGIPGPGSWSFGSLRGADRGSGDQDRGEQLDRVSRELPYPCVVKPAQGSGSRGIRLVDSAEELLALLGSGTLDDGFLVEEYLPDDPSVPSWLGSYVSVESIVTPEAIVHSAVTGRFPLASPFRECGNILPALVPDGLLADLLELATRAATALRAKAAVIHTEIKLTPDGPRLIEVNGRLGGRPPFVLASVSDVNLFVEACRVACGVPTTITGLVPCRQVGFWLMFQPPEDAQTLTAVGGLDKVRDLDGVDRVEQTTVVGQPVDPGAGTDGKVVTVRGRAADHQDLERLTGAIREHVHLEFAPNPALSTA